jgi:predicted permease
VAQLATPLALIGLGAGFEGRKALAKIKPTVWASAIKLVIQPLIFLPIAVWMGFTGEKIIAILIMLAAPATPSCYIMAKNMKNDGVLTASIVVLTTLLAAFTLTGWIYLVKVLNLI